VGTKLQVLLLSLTAMAGVSQVAVAQSPSFRTGQARSAAASNGRVEQGQRFRPDGAAVQEAIEGSAAGPTELASSSPGDPDLGEQVILKRRDKTTPFSAFASITGFYTNNAALTNADQVDDFFFVGEVGVSYQPRITRDLVAEITVRQAAFRYAKFDELDFESLNTGAGLTYVVRPLGGIALTARYNYNRLTDGSEHDEFFKNQTLTLGVLKSFELSKAHYIYLGYSTIFGWSDPVAPQRDEHGVFLGYHLNLTRALSGGLFYRLALFDYLEGRDDWNQTLAVSLKWEVTRWFNIAATASGGFNESNRDVFDYDVFNAGLTLSGTFTF
jgi:hypothetical protein